MTWILRYYEPAEIADACRSLGVDPDRLVVLAERYWVDGGDLVDLVWAVLCDR